MDKYLRQKVEMKLDGGTWTLVDTIREVLHNYYGAVTYVLTTRGFLLHVSRIVSVEVSR